MNGFDWLTGNRILGLVVAGGIAILAGVLLGWLDWWAERVAQRHQSDDWRDEGNIRPRWRLW